MKAVSDLNFREVVGKSSTRGLNYGKNLNRQRRVGQFTRQKSQQHVDSEHSVDSLPTSSYCIKGTP